ncbi:hypothetical protein HGRIS_011533 [Hohenbuehelia grisea]|uniref:Uncharacterized protein n=1 Tax=Hohenbuehelia grisea TaxID=104357 RepID=A0ABR3JXF2_9AGAR
MLFVGIHVFYLTSPATAFPAFGHPRCFSRFSPLALIVVPSVCLPSSLTGHPLHEPAKPLPLIFTFIYPSIPTPYSHPRPHIHRGFSHYFLGIYLAHAVFVVHHVPIVYILYSAFQSCA